MPRMNPMEAVVRVLEDEGVKVAFGVPGAAILPLYDAMRHSNIRHLSVRHEEGGTHAADGWARITGEPGICIGTSGPAGTNMITGLYTAQADSIPMICITGQANHRRPAQGGLPGRRHRRHRQAGVQVGLPGQGDGAAAVGVPRGVPRRARGPARAGAHRPAARRAEGRGHRVRPRHRRPAGLHHARAEPAGHRRRARAAGGRRAAADPGGRRRDPGRGVRGARRAGRGAADPGVPHLHGQGGDPGGPPAVGGDGRHPDHPALRQPDLPGERRRAGHRRALRRPPHRRPRRLPRRPQVHPRRHLAGADRARVPGRPRHRQRREARAAGAGRAGGGALGALARDLGGARRAAQGHAGPAHGLRRRADQAAARLPGAQRVLRPGHDLRDGDRPVPDLERTVPDDLQAAPLPVLRAGRPAGLGGPRLHRGQARRARPARGRRGRRLLLPVPDGGGRRRGPVRGAVRARHGQQRLHGPDPPGREELRHELRRRHLLRGPRRPPGDRPRRGHEGDGRGRHAGQRAGRDLRRPRLGGPARARSARSRCSSR